jgi:hypothetical protein
MLTSFPTFSVCWLVGQEPPGDGAETMFQELRVGMEVVLRPRPSLASGISTSPRCTLMVPCQPACCSCSGVNKVQCLLIPFTSVLYAPACSRDAGNRLRLQDLDPGHPWCPVPLWGGGEHGALAGPGPAPWHSSRSTGTHLLRTPPHWSFCMSSKDIILLQSNVISCVCNKPLYFLLSPPE